MWDWIAVLSLSSMTMAKSLTLSELQFFYLLNMCYKQRFKKVSGVSATWWITLHDQRDCEDLIKITNCVVVQSLSHVWLCNPKKYRTPGFPVLHYLLEFAQTYVHWVSDAIQPFDPLLPLRWPKNWSFRFSSSPSMNIQSWFPLGWTGLISLLSKRYSRVFSSTTVQKHQFFGIQLSLWSNPHIHTRILEKP